MAAAARSGVMAAFEARCADHTMTRRMAPAAEPFSTLRHTNPATRRRLHAARTGAHGPRPALAKPRQHLAQRDDPVSDLGRAHAAESEHERVVAGRLDRESRDR